MFEKGYRPKWSEEHFQIKSRIPKRKPVLKLADDLGDKIKGQFYQEELQPIEENRYLIERIFRKRKTQQGTQYGNIGVLHQPEQVTKADHVGHVSRDRSLAP